MGLPPRDHLRHTYGEYLTWPDDVPCELIDGAALLKPSSYGLTHQEVVGGVFGQVANQLQHRGARVLAGPLDVLLPIGEEADEDCDTVVQPDVIAVCDESKVGRRAIRGAPDWVLEVLSPSTASHDQVTKRRIYERAGVKEFWLVHPVDKVLTVYRFQGAEYGRPDIQELKGSTAIAVLPGVSIEWDALAERLPKPDYY